MAVAFNPIGIQHITASGDLIPIEGNNTIENHSTSSPYTAPEGALYVTVSFDAATTITATPVKGDGGQPVTGYSRHYTNAGEVQIPVIGGKTVITTSQS